MYKNNMISLDLSELEKVAGGKKGVNIISVPIAELAAGIIGAVKSILMVTLKEESDRKIVEAAFNSSETRLVNKISNNAGINVSTIVKIAVETICDTVNAIPSVPAEAKAIVGNKMLVMTIVKQAIKATGY